MEKDIIEKKTLRGETKKPYESPVLSIYGDVKKITQTTKFAGVKDSSMS